MTSFRATLSVPPRSETGASSENAPDAARPTAAVGGATGGINRGPARAKRVEAAEADPYLAPALRAAAAARARTARIRAGQAQHQLPSTPQPPPERRPPPAAVAADPGPQQPIVEPRTTTALPAAPRGLSVAAAARAATVAFRPLPRRPEALAQAWSPATPASPAGPTPPAPEPAAIPAAPQPPPPQPAPRQQRFARTIAAVERSQAASRERQPGSSGDNPPDAGIVPRSALRRPDPASAGSPWSRLWSLRKDAAAE